MSPESAEDIGYLWDITYNLHWSSSSSTASRFAADVSRLLDGDLGCCSVAEAGGQVSGSNGSSTPNLAALQGIWGYWLKALEDLDVQEVQEKR